MLSSTDLVQAVTADLEKIRETAPLVLSLTNSVVQPLTANLLLAIGAVPAMLNDAEEAVDMLRSGTGALLVNLGTVTREQGAAMQTAVREANRLNNPLGAGSCGRRGSFPAHAAGGAIEGTIPPHHPRKRF